MSAFSFYQSYHFTLATARQRRNGLLQLVEFEAKLTLNQEANPQRAGHWTQQLQQNLEAISDACLNLQGA